MRTTSSSIEEGESFRKGGGKIIGNHVRSGDLRRAPVQPDRSASGFERIEPTSAKCSDNSGKDITRPGARQPSRRGWSETETPIG